MMRFLFLLAVALGACVPQSLNPEQADSAAPPAVPVLGPVSSLAGEWRVAGIDGQPFDESYGLALSGSDSELWWSPKCAEFVRSYRIAGGSIGFGPSAGAPASDGRPAPVCLPGLPARLGAVFAAIDSAQRIERTPANGIEISGGGHSLLLFSQ
jgi:hypothetical protein